MPFSLPSPSKQPCTSSHNHSPPDVPIIITSVVKKNLPPPFGKCPEGCKNLQTKQGGLYNAVSRRKDINVHKARHYHSLHLLGDLVSSEVVIKGPVDTPVWRVMADGVSALAVHLGYCGFLVFLKYKRERNAEENLKRVQGNHPPSTPPFWPLMPALGFAPWTLWNGCWSWAGPAQYFFFPMYNYVAKNFRILTLNGAHYFYLVTCFLVSNSHQNLYRQRGHSKTEVSIFFLINQIISDMKLHFQATKRVKKKKKEKRSVCLQEKQHAEWAGERTGMLKLWE